MTIKRINSKNSFTLMEILIIVSLIAIIAVVSIIFINPRQQMAKAHDSGRKNELTTLQKAMEDYYNDKGCYPKPEELCYDLPPTKVCAVGGGSYSALDSLTCHICGNESGSPSFPYLPKLPCDPQHSRKKYFYQVAAMSGFLCTTTEDGIDPCPQWYRIYSNLEVESDSALGCQGSGCGIAPDYGYDYGVSSPNETLGKAPVFFCYTMASKRCNNCNLYSDCITNPNCGDIYPSRNLCCQRLPKPKGCP